MELVAFISGVIFIVITLIVLVNTVKGLIFGLKKSVGALVGIVLSALIAGVATAIICKPDSAMLNGIMASLPEAFPDGAIHDVLAIEALGESVTYYGIMLVAPFVFLVLYLITSLINSIVLTIIIRFIPPFKKPNATVNSLSGLGVGLVCAFLVVIITLSPVVGTISIVGDVFEDVAAGEEEISPDMAENLEATSRNQTVNLLNSLGSGAIYDLFASADFDGERVYLRKDASALASIAMNIKSLGRDMSHYDGSQKEALEALVETIDASPLIKHALAGALSEASAKWLADEEFLGVSRFNAGELLDPMVDRLLVIISTTDKYTVGADIKAMSHVFITLIDSGILRSEDSKDMLLHLGESDVISDLLVTINANVRTRPLADEITRLSVRAMGSIIGIPGNSEERYDMLMNNLAYVVSHHEEPDVSDRVAGVSHDIGTIFDDYGMEVNPDALDRVAQSMITDLGVISELSGNDIKEFFEVYAIGASNSVMQSGEGGFKPLSDAEESDDIHVEFNEDGTITFEGVVLHDYTADNYRESGAYTLALSGVDIGDASSLDMAKHMKSSLLTLEDILASLGSYLDCADVVAESEIVAKILSEVGHVFSELDLDDLNYRNLLVQMGDVFDMMSESEVFNDATVRNITTAVLQSDMIKDSMSLTKSNLTEFANKLNEYALSSEGSFSDATKAVSVTFEAIDKNSDAEISYEEKISATENMITSLVIGNAEVITSVITDSFVVDQGIEVSNAEAVSNSIQCLINSMADFNESAPDEEAVKEEAEAVSSILSLALSGMNDAPLFDTEDENGIVASDPDEFISTVVNSTIVMNAVEEIVEGKDAGTNPYGLDEFDEDQKENIENALMDYYLANGEGADLAEMLEDISIVLNVNFVPEY